MKPAAPDPPPGGRTAEVSALLEREPDVVGAYLFGSRARDEARPDSDLDLAVLFDPPATLDRLVDLENRLEQSLGLRVRSPTSPGPRPSSPSPRSRARRMLAGAATLPLATEAAFLADPRMVAAGESFLRRALEALFDLGRHLLAKGFGEPSWSTRSCELRVTPSVPIS